MHSELSASRLFHTLRWLRGRQLAGQLRRRWERIFERPAAFARRPASELPGLRWKPAADFVPPGAQRNAAGGLLSGSFRFLNRSERLGWPPRWENPGLPQLWEYNLHYFEYLWALPYEDARTLVRDWIARHGLDKDRVGWEPYPISVRLPNWCAFFHGRHRERTERDAGFRAELWRSLELQAGWLEAHLETHLLGNHLLENGAALAVCGACFAGPRADRWLQRGLELLARQLPEQVLGDGGHFERSPMYHARTAYLLGLLANTGHADLEQRVAEPLERMRGALQRMCHPDGEIALLNDSAIGIHNPPVQLLGSAPAPGAFALPETGYYGARAANGHYLICDAGPIGPDYLPGHAHGDIFSVELSLDGRRVIVDAGVHGYEADTMRRYCRSTRAHNTVEVEGQDQCEFWAAFRVARRGRPRDVAWQVRDDGFALEGWHDGYRRLRGRPRHERRFRWHDAGVLLVRDRVTSGRPVASRSRVHLHPDCELVDVTGNRVRVGHPGGEFSVCFAGAGELSTEPSLYCPEFGTRLDNRALVFGALGKDVVTGFCVARGSGSVEYDLDAGVTLNGRHFPW